MLLSIFIFVASALHTLASPISSSHVVHERRAVASDIRGSRLHEDAIIPLRIGLKQSNLERGYDMVMDVSDPRSRDYGKHWTLQQVRDYFAPPPEAIESVKEWLVASGVAPEYIQLSEDRAWIGVNLPNAQAEHLLRAEYHEYYPGRDASVRIGCEEYSLPQHISRLVDYVKPGISLSPPALKHREVVGKVQSLPAGGIPPELQLQKCGSFMSLACQRALYSIPQGTYNTSANSLAIAMMNNSHYYQPDLDAWYTVVEYRVPNNTHPVLISIDSGEGPTEDVDYTIQEANLDLDIAIPLVYPQTTIFLLGWRQTHE